MEHGFIWLEDITEEIGPVFIPSKHRLPILQPNHSLSAIIPDSNVVSMDENSTNPSEQFVLCIELNHFREMPVFDF